MATRCSMDSQDNPEIRILTDSVVTLTKVLFNKTLPENAKSGKCASLTREGKGSS